MITSSSQNLWISGQFLVFLCEDVVYSEFHRQAVEARHMKEAFLGGHREDVPWAQQLGDICEVTTDVAKGLLSMLE